MATFFADGAVKKQRMQNVPMHVHRLKSEIQRTFFEMDVIIHQFFKLKDNTWYDWRNHELDCHLSVSKRSGDVKLLFKIKNSNLYTVNCALFYTNDVSTDFIVADKLPGLPFEINLPSKVIHNKKNKLIQRGILVFKLHIIRENEQGLPRPCAGSRMRLSKRNSAIASENEIREQSSNLYEVEKLFRKDLKNMFKKTLFLDFTICFQGDTLQIPKALLAARSKFFRDYICENGESIELDTTGEVLSRVIAFMWFGKFHVTDLELLLQVLELASKLKIRRLVELCVHFIKYNTDCGNAYRIRKVGYNTGLENLVKMADHVLVAAETENK